MSLHYYPWHYGDYMKHAAHLEPMEDLAHRRCIDAYYMRGGPLPRDVLEVARLIRMRPYETEVGAVLREFFEDTPEGWRNRRADKEIAEALGLIASKQERTEHERARKDRHRQRRKALFDALRERGIVPPFDTSLPELEAMLSGDGDMDGDMDVTTTGTKQGKGRNGHGVTNPNPNPTPKGSSPRATRLPKDFVPEPEPEAERGIDRELELAKFRDYWNAKAGKDACKADWQATWRNWARNAFRKNSPADVARMTVPGPLGEDPALKKIREDEAKAAPMTTGARALQQSLHAATVPRR